MLNKNSAISTEKKETAEDSQSYKSCILKIDLSLDRIKNLCSKLGNPQDDINCIQVCGTNGKGSTISFLRSILREANIKCNIYTSPHVRRINERFIYNDEMINDDDLSDLLNEIEKINNGQPLTYFEALTTAFLWV